MIDVIIIFDYVFVQYVGFVIDDCFIVFVFEDCGVIWIIVYNEGGVSFVIVLVFELFFIVGSGDWVVDIIDLSVYDGIVELNVCFFVQIDWGNNFFLDNIIVESGIVVSVDEVNKLEGKVFIYFNLVIDLVYVDFIFVEKSDVIVEVFDIFGKVIIIFVVNLVFGIGVYQLCWVLYQVGLYLICVFIFDSVFIKCVIVVK